MNTEAVVCSSVCMCVLCDESRTENYLLQSLRKSNSCSLNESSVVPLTDDLKEVVRSE